MASRIQFRRANAANWTSANPVLAAGELGYELDTAKFKIGNGTSAWNDLGYAKGEKGDPGIQGETGATGAAGADGNTILSGSGTPSNSLGVNDDFYIDTTNHLLFGPKASGSWGSGLSLVGPTGAQGATGPNGATGPQGPKGDPGVGINFKGSVADVIDLDDIVSPLEGDAYIINATGDLYVWNGTSWTNAGQIVGPQGPQGIQGETGVVTATAPVTYDSGTKTVALSFNSGLTTANGALVPDFGSTSGKVAQGNDSRFSDARTPTAHKTTHATGGTDALSASDIGAAASGHDHSGTYIPTTAAGSANGVATLDANSKIPSTQLPGIAITSTYVVNGLSAMNALSVEEGDIAVRTDQNKSYIYTGSAWQELLTPTDAVTSVDGSTGAVSLSGTYVPQTRTVSTTSPLTGGGALSGDLTLSVNGGSTSAAGVVQLTDSTSSTSTTTAATPSSVKSAYDLAGGAIPKSTVTTAGDLIVASGNSTVTRLAAGATDSVLTSSGTGAAPSWKSITTVIADGSITSAKIADGTIVNADISASAAIATSKLASNSITINSTTVALGGSATVSAAPTAHASTHGSAGSDPVSIASTQVSGLGTAAGKDIPASGDASTSQVVYGTDTRLTNARTPTAHKSTHATGGTDALAPSDIGAATSGHNHSGTYIESTAAGAANGVATLDGNSKVPTSQLPALAITSTYVVVDATAQAALSPQEGDVAIRTDENKSYIYTASNTWQELLSPGTVTSVDGRTGTVSLSDRYAAITHATTHGSAGSDPITIASTQVTGLGTAAGKDIPASGNASTSQVVYGTDTRLSDTRTPSDGSVTDAKVASNAAIADTKLGTISTAGKVSNSATTANAANGASTIVARDANGGFSANAISATTFTGSLTGTASGNVPNGRTITTTSPLRIGGGASADLSADRTLTINTFGGDSGSGGSNGIVPAPAAGDAAANKYLKANGVWATPTAAEVSAVPTSRTVAGTNGITVNTVATTGQALSSDVTLGISDGGIADAKLGTISTAGKVSNSATTAASANGANSIVARDANGSFSANTINGTTIPSTKTLVVTTDKLSVHAATSSLELASVISDETGSGLLVFGTTPTLTTPVITQGTATPTFASNIYTLASGDAGLMLLASNAATAGSVKIPTNASVPFAIGTQIHVIQTGTGQLTISAVTSGTTTVNSSASSSAAPALRTQYSAATMLKTATDTWYVFGDIS